MAVNRIVANIAASNPDATRAFYAGLLRLDVVMDRGLIGTPVKAGALTTTPQPARTGRHR